MKNRLLLILFISLICCLSAKAYHIIGGDLSYECLGNDEYFFELIIYRDCGNPNGDQLDARAPITIYQANGARYDLFFDGQIQLESVRNLDPELDNPCLQLPPALCVQEGIYRFTTTLPKSPQSYHVTYQRCCRNNTINNIARPSELGITFTVEITPKAQDLCNSGPKFNEFPPIAICANEPLFFDHSATDIDGDSVVYEFCEPLNGAGTRGFLQNGSPTACDGFRPNPSCAPPYKPISYILPDYTASEPMGGDPKIRIDSRTGLITGTPDRIGQFVVGVCATEYRDGFPISTLRRDFQFNVASCDPTVVASIRADEVTDNRFIIKSCGDNEIQFQNRSTIVSNIENLSWQFNLPGGFQEFTSWSPKVTFPDSGDFFGQLILNRNLPCSDTANILVKISPEITPDFTFDYDTCVAGAVAFFNQTNMQGIDTETTEWQFGNGDNSLEENPRYEYRDPGNPLVSLQIKDENDCFWSTQKRISYFPVPSLIVIAPDDFLGCVPGDVFFNNLSFPIDDTYEINWNFGDGETGDDISPTHTFWSDGIFDISVEITSPIGCTTDTVFENLIEILPRPIAAFDFLPKKLNQFNNHVTFDNFSENANRWVWQFDSTTSVEKYPVHTFRDTGQHEVRLIAIHPEGCMDTAFAKIDVVPEARYFLPNAFSPNNDSNNDLFSGVGEFTAIRDFRMTVWNRWGELIFEADRPEKEWNGKKNNVGNDVPDGVYVVKVQYRTSRGETVDYRGVVTVVR